VKRRAVVASCPTRIDLAGGTLDIWPLQVLVPDAVTVNLGVTLRAWAAIEPSTEARATFVSEDQGARWSSRLPLPSGAKRLRLLVDLARTFPRDRGGFTLTTRAEAPAGAGLGGSSALAIAASAALDRFTGAGLSKHELLVRASNVEARILNVPTGNQDYLAALHGGLTAWHHTVDGTRKEVLPIPQGLESRLVLAYTGQPRGSGFSNWDMFRRFVDSEPPTVKRMQAIARIARDLREALVRGKLDDAGELLGEEGRLRVRLAPSVGTPALERASKAAARAGSLGVKVCGAGGGGCLVAFAAKGRREQVAAAMEGAGARVLDARIAKRGLVVSERRSGS